MILFITVCFLKKKNVPPVNIKWYLVFFPLILSPPPIIDVKYIFGVFFGYLYCFFGELYFLSWFTLFLYFLPDSVSPLVGKAITTQSVTGLTYLNTVDNLQEMAKWAGKACDLCIINNLVFRVHNFNKDSMNSKFVADGLVLDIRGLRIQDTIEPLWKQGFITEP